LDPALQLHNNFDDIMKLSDCIFTPVEGEAQNDPNLIINWYTDYELDYWNAKQTGYVNRSWCRLEMLAAANVPVDSSQPQRLEKFCASLKHYISHAVRPHYLFSRVEEMLQVDAIALPPLRPHLFKTLNPEEGTVTIKDDQLKITELYAKIKQYMDPRPMGYFGESQNNKMHGPGVMKYESGSQYKGNFVKGKKHGYGVFIYAKGNSYRGEWLIDKKCGRGVFMHSSGNVYEGITALIYLFLSCLNHCL
jgi:hypothetical protein